ncbi:methanogenesis marker 16 metalloprotein [Methanomethylovorans sp.]|uniref:methanogenesis marker 16 metalloprotein n=1 Tax=Methanomethylovorans sp. TaxID=2758717 RepID=UPI00351C7DD6
MERTVEEICEKISKREAVVMTAHEICRLVMKGEDIKLEDVDVVTTGTRAIMSGTYAVMSFPIEAPRQFTRAKKIFLNGVPAFSGPCPNERLGILDLMVFGTSHSNLRPDYGAGHLFREMVQGKEIEVSVITDENDTFTSSITLDEMPFARLFGTRHCFKNYSAFVNCSSKAVNTIFHATGFNPDLSGATVSGCGEINPVKNDPLLETIGIGTRFLMNGSEGFVIGSGTRSSAARPNLTGFADMHDMDPQLMGGFATSAGPECIVSWAIPIPVTSQVVLDAIKTTDAGIPLPVMDVDCRKPIGQADYGNVWHDVDLAVMFKPSACRQCPTCEAEEKCPMDAIYWNNGKLVLDRYLCFNCGLCSTLCPAGVFTARLGSIKANMKCCDAESYREVPIVLRQSDRKRALKMAEDLKNKVIDGSFRIGQMAERLK